MGVNVDFWIANDTFFILPNQEFDLFLNFPFDGNNWARLSVLPQPNSPSKNCVILSEYTNQPGTLHIRFRNGDTNNVLAVRATAIVVPSK